jgi:hypothetical protein
VVGVVVRLLLCRVSVVVGGMLRLAGGFVLGMRRRLRWNGVCCGVWVRRFPNCPVVCVAGLGLFWACLAGAWHRKPGGRCVGQWCQGVGGWHGQHHVMDERMAPQL